MITNRLVSLVRRNRAPHQIPAPLIALDQALSHVVVDEHQEADTLMRARQTVFNTQGHTADSTQSARPRSRPSHKAATSIAAPIAVSLLAVTLGVAAAITPLISWTASPIAQVGISALLAIILLFNGSLVMPLATSGNQKKRKKKKKKKKKK
jgi:hypothetical protein